jgi:hypothetical protein
MMESMKTTLLLFFALAVCGFAQTNPCGDIPCTDGSCQPCHYQSNYCVQNGGSCIGCGEYCLNIAQLAPETRRALTMKRALDYIQNPMALTDAGKLWQQSQHAILPSLARTPGSHLPLGHPSIAKSISTVSRCQIVQQAQLLRMDLSAYRK